MKLDKKDLYKKVYNWLSMIALTFLTCFAVWSIFKGKSVLKFLGIFLFNLCIWQMVDLTKYKTALDKGDYYICQGLFNLIDKNTLSIGGNLYNVSGFSGLDKIIDGEEVYLVVIAGKPITIYRVKLVELSDELKRNVV